MVEEGAVERWEAEREKERTRERTERDEGDLNYPVLMEGQCLSIDPKKSPASADSAELHLGSCARGVESSMNRIARLIGEVGCRGSYESL